MAFPLCLGALGTLQAAVIPTLFSTGVNDANELIGPREVDTHYTLTASPDSNYPGPDAYTLAPGFPVGPWVAEGPLSRWIAPRPEQGIGNAPGTYTFTTTFDLTGFDPASARIEGQVSADDALGAIRLNGTRITLSGIGGFNGLWAFSIPAGSTFVDGINTLEFDAVNGGASANPTGFRVELVGNAVGTAEAPSIVKQPISQTVVVGDIVNFSVVAEGTPPLTYEWRFKGNKIDGAIDPSLTLNGVNLTDLGAYTVKISNPFGNIESDPATLTVLVPFPGIYNTGVSDNRQPLTDLESDTHYELITNPQDSSVNRPLAMINLPSPPWVPNSNKSRWIGPTDNTSAAPGEYIYRLQLDLTGFDPSTAFLAGSWATDDGGALYLNGADTGFRSAGYASMVEFNLTGGFVSGINNLELHVVNGGAAANPSGLRVENLRGTAKPSVVVGSAPKVVAQPKGGINILTTSRTLTAVADGLQPLSYQWFHDGVAIDGQTSSSLVLNSITTTDGGDYWVHVSNALGSTDSAKANIRVIVPEFGFFNTGVDAIGNALKNSEADRHYLLLESGDATYAGPYAYAAGSLPSPPWVVNDGGSRWLTPRPDASETAPGNYTYRLFFFLTADEAASVSVIADVATDDGNGGIFLNGSRVSFGASGFGGYTALNIPQGSPFVEGLNTLDFIINNGGASANPTGLRVNHLEAVGITQRPYLLQSASPDGLQLRWSALAADFVLQEASSPNGPWSDATANISVEPTQVTALIPMADAAKFYRLAK